MVLLSIICCHRLMRLTEDDTSRFCKFVPETARYLFLGCARFLQSKQVPGLIHLRSKRVISSTFVFQEAKAKVVARFYSSAHQWRNNRFHWACDSSWSHVFGGPQKVKSTWKYETVTCGPWAAGYRSLL